MLLPKPPAELELEDDLRRPLVEQLLEYQKFKLAAQSLKEKEDRTAQYWPRPSTFDAESNREELVEANLYDLVHAFALLIKRTGRRAELEIRADQFSVKQKIQELLEYLEAHEHFSLMEYAKSMQSRGEMIVLFLAILEMIRLSMMRIFQGETFGDILIYRQISSAKTKRKNKPPGRHERQGARSTPRRRGDRGVRKRGYGDDGDGGIRQLSNA